jgi:hypothetical protein
MSLFVRWRPRSGTIEQYDESVRRLMDSAEGFPPEGMAFHVCTHWDGSFQVSEIWDSQEQFAAFGESVMPVLSEAGIEPGHPEIVEVHNDIRR